MIKGLTGVVGLASNYLPFRRRKSRSFTNYLPFGGFVPVAAAYLLWQNRDKIRSLYNRVAHHQYAAAAA